MRLLTPLICLLLVTLPAGACGDSSPLAPSVGLSEPFTLAPGEVARIGTTDLQVQFIRVSNDSRCPADALCILGGDAIVHIRIFDADGVAAYELHTGNASLSSVTHGSVRLSLDALEPYPFSSLPPIAPGDYRATLVAARV
jgi:hypothetical protein